MKWIEAQTKQIYTRQLERNKNSISDLDWLRLRIVFVLNFVFFVFFIPTIFIEFLSGKFMAASLGVIVVLTLVFSNILIFRGHLKLPIFITALILPALGFIIAFLGAVSYQAMFPQLCLLLALIIWILSNHRVKIIYTIIYLLLLSVLFNLHNSLQDTMVTMLLISGYLLLFIVVTLFHERQDHRLFNSLKDQKLLNETLVIKNDKLQTYSHIMSHDLKRPIVTIGSFSQLIKQKVQFENESHKQYFDFIEKSTIEMKTLIDELMLFHEVESGVQDFDTIDLNEIIDSISSIYHDDLIENRIKFKFNSLPKVKGNYTLLKALFRNLISNAIKYQPKEKVAHIPEIEIWSTTDETDGIEIYLSDNGIGIDESYAKKLFIPFKRFHNRNEYEGTGLGMSICKSVMEKHLGSIDLHESSENGTTFKLNFPKMILSKTG